MERDAKENEEVYARERDALEVCLPLLPLSSLIHRALDCICEEGRRAEDREGEQMRREGTVGGTVIYLLCECTGADYHSGLS